MYLSYDHDVDTLYIRLYDGERIVCRTDEVDGGTLVDLDEQGHVLGIEVITPARRWPLDDIAQRYRLDAGTLEEIRAAVGGRHNEPFHFGQPPLTPA